MSPNPVLAFDVHELDEDRWELRRHGLPVPVQPRVLGLLLYLARRRDRVVTHSELLAALWTGVSVTDASVLRAVCLARRALGERAGDSRRIRTYHRRGYRFCAPVHEIWTSEVQTVWREAR